VPVLFALLAAFSNALNVIMQHIASIGDPGHSKGWRFIRYLLSNPFWLLGWVALAAAFVFQALALHNGLMSVVQPLLVTELVFALLLRWLWLRQEIHAVTWWAAVITCVLLALFIAMAEPSGGSALPTSRAWASATAAVLGLAALLAVVGLGGSPGRRAASLAASASVLWALVATFIKATTDTLTQFGVAGMFTHWPFYALAVTGLAAELLNQAALHVGPLSISQPFIVIVDPIVSIALSVWIFGESFTSDVTRLAVASFAFAGMCVAVTVLARTAPATMDPDPTPTSPLPGRSSPSSSAWRPRRR
jgi:drug/metabolite transporter (DMT)-like permease